VRGAVQSRAPSGASAPSTGASCRHVRRAPAPYERAARNSRRTAVAHRGDHRWARRECSSPSTSTTSLRIGRGPISRVCAAKQPRRPLLALRELVALEVHAQLVEKDELLGAGCRGCQPAAWVALWGCGRPPTGSPLVTSSHSSFPKGSSQVRRLPDPSAARLGEPAPPAPRLQSGDPAHPERGQLPRCVEAQGDAADGRSRRGCPRSSCFEGARGFRDVTDHERNLTSPVSLADGIGSTGRWRRRRAMTPVMPSRPRPVRTRRSARPGTAGRREHEASAATASARAPRVALRDGWRVPSRRRATAFARRSNRSSADKKRNAPMSRAPAGTTSRVSRSRAAPCWALGRDHRR
jgi:hypothetical protein